MSDERLGEGPGNRLAGKGWIFFVTLYQLAAVLALLYLLIRLWPHPTPSQAQRSETTAATAVAATKAVVPASCCRTCEERRNKARIEFADAEGKTKFDPECISMFGHDYLIWNEQRMLLLILIAGALGGLVRSVRSLYWYVGNRSFVISWVLMYLLLPLAGSLIALFIYLLLRGGLFSPQASMDQTSPFGFVAIAALAGMFSGSAAEKLKEMFELLFKREPPARDSAAPNPKPVLEGIDPTGTTAGKPVELRVTGKSFVKDSKVLAGGAEMRTTFVSDTNLTCQLDGATVQQPGTVKIAVTSPEPGGGTSAASLDFVVAEGEAG